MSDEEGFRKLQRSSRDLWRRAKNKVTNSTELSEAKDAIKSATATVNHKISEAKQSYDTSDAARIINPLASGAASAISSAATSVATKSKEFDQKYKVTDKAREAASTVADSVDSSIGKPLRSRLEETGIAKAVSQHASEFAEIYGSARSFIKPYFASESTRELLENTRSELVRINACIMQISTDEADAWAARFGKVLSAKLAGVAGTSTLFALVAAYGTASTGTAIAGLSGAAATSATLFQIGSVFGGGMATGGLVLGGIGIAVGYGVYKLMSSTARDFDDLPEKDQRLVGNCATLIVAIDERLANESVEMSGTESAQFLEGALKPLYRYLEANVDDICSRLDNKNAVAFRQHVMRDFPKVVLDGFAGHVATKPVGLEGVIGGVIYALLTRSVVSNTPEDQLVLAAIKRGLSDLHNASEAEISDYLSALAPEQVQGLANNIKGIYHELMWVAEYNASHTDTEAVLPEATNYPGADVLILDRDTNVVVDRVQLKATSDPSYVAEHFERYPNIEVFATTEASSAPNVHDSGFTNSSMSHNTTEVIDGLADNTLGDRVIESAEYASLLSAGREALELLQGNGDLSESAKRVAATTAQAAAATGITAYLFS